MKDDFKNLPASKKEVLKLGLKRYFTGKPCKYGHISARYTTSNCVECRKTLRSYSGYYKKYYANYYAKRREWELERQKKYRADNPEKIKFFNKRWRKNNKEKYQLSNEKWRKNNSEYWNIHRQKNKHLYRVYAFNRKNRTKGKLSADIHKKLLKSQRGRCAICSIKLGADVTVDHIIPLSKGGINLDSNVQLVHRKCNSRKHTIDPITFMRRLGKLL